METGKGYTYLQTAVEKITRRRIDDLMQTVIYNPLDMEDAAMVWTGPMNRTMARTVDEKGKMELPRTRCQHTVAIEPNCAFSLYVTVKDYPKYPEGKLVELLILKENISILEDPLRSMESSISCLWTLNRGGFES